MADIRTVIAAMEPQLRRAFLTAIADIQSEVQLAIIVRALQDGRIEDAITALRLDPVFFEPVAEALTGAYLEGARDALEGIPRLPDPLLKARLLLSVLTGETDAQRTGSEQAVRD